LSSGVKAPNKRKKFVGAIVFFAAHNQSCDCIWEDRFIKLFHQPDLVVGSHALELGYPAHEGVGLTLGKELGGAVGGDEIAEPVPRHSGYHAVERLLAHGGGGLGGVHDGMPVTRGEGRLAGYVVELTHAIASGTGSRITAGGK